MKSKELKTGDWIEVRDPGKKISYGQGGSGLYRVVRVGRVNVVGSVDVRFSPTGAWHHQEHKIPLSHVVRVAPEVSTKEFTSRGGRVFTVGIGTHTERYTGDPLWDDCFPIFLNGEQAGKLYRSEGYGRTASGEPRWQGTLNQLRWTVPKLPDRCGFDVSAFDTHEAALEAWGRSADQILDFQKEEIIK